MITEPYRGEWVSMFVDGKAQHFPATSPAGLQALALIGEAEGPESACQAPLCGKTFTGKHPDARFCSSACSQRAARRRRAGARSER